MTTTAVLTGNTKYLDKNNPDRLDARSKIFFPVKLMNTTDFLGTGSSTLSNNSKVVVSYPNGVNGAPHLVNVCSKEYALVTAENIILPFEEILGKHFDFEARYMHKDHSTFYIDYKFDKPAGMPPEVGDIIPSVRLTHSYTGKVKFAVHFRFFRLVCSNGMTAPAGDFAYVKGKHTYGDLVQSIQKAFAAVAHFATKAGDYAKKYAILAQPAKWDFTERLEEAIKGTGYPRSLMTAVAERALYENRKEGVLKSDWLMYNAMNYQLSHNYAGTANQKGLKMQENNRMKLDEKVLNWFLTNQN